MTPRDWALVVSALVNFGLLVLVTWLLDRLQTERRACRHQCPLVETVQQQLRSLTYAWAELDRHARAKRATIPEYSMDEVDKMLDAINREL